MPSRSAPVVINQFVGGLNTEANPLSFPVNASSDELNVDINTNGTRIQRSGMDAESGYVSVDTGIIVNGGAYIGRSEFRWYNPGGDSSKQLIVIQIGNYIGIHNIAGGDSLSSDRIYNNTLGLSSYSNNWSYAVIDGILVVATGEDVINLFEYDVDAGTISHSTKRLKIRDFFGTSPTTTGGLELWDIDNLNYRPTAVEVDNNYVYNLRNGTYGLPTLNETDNTTLSDPIVSFRVATGNSSNLLPSLSDNALNFFYARTSYTNLPTSDRYNQSDNYKYKPNKTRSPYGKFIIDALTRGDSRNTVFENLYDSNSELSYGSATKDYAFKTDKTEGGVKVVEDYAGRVWFAGFSSEIDDPEETSPLMGSYLLFSQIVTSKNEINRCYQVVDPTDPYDNELVDSDGGYIRISGAYDIVNLLSMGPYLFVFARNGVWQISGVDSNIFNATSFSVSKISEYGCITGQSVVQVGGDAFYWGEDGIYLITVEQLSGEYSVQNTTETTIKTFYDNISNRNKESVSGYYDVQNSNVRWLYGSGSELDSTPKELVFNLKFASFLPFEFTQDVDNGVVGPITSAGGFTTTNDIVSNITANSVLVTANSSQVTITEPDVEISSSSSFYCIILSTTPTISYTFGGYREDSFEDWGRLLLSSVLPSCYLQTGPVSGADGRTRKSIMYITTHFPNGGSGGYSCRITGKWGWSTDVTTGRWTSTREAYRYNTSFDNHDIVSTRNKLRGSGKAISIRFENDGVSPLAIYGWEYDLGANNEE